MSHPDEGLIHAWLDGELDAAEAARIAGLVQSDPAWAAAAAEARGFIAATSRIVRALDDVPANVIPAARTAVPPSEPKVIPLAPKHRGTPWWALRAAAVLVVVAGTVVVMRDGTPEVVEAVPEVAESTDDLKDSAVAPLLSAPTAAAPAPASAPAPAPQLRNDAASRRASVGEADAARQLAVESKAKEAEIAKLSVTAAAPPALPQPAGAATAAVGAGSAPASERRALGFAAKSMDQASPSEQCFREQVVSGARELGAMHRVRVAADSTARAANETLRARARVEASADLAPSASRSLRVHGDTLIIIGAEGLTVRALRVSCPSP